VVHNGRVSEKEYDTMMAECGLLICTSAAEGFCHAVNEGMSAECILLLSPIEALRELTHKALWVSSSKSVPHPECVGVLEDVDVPVRHELKGPQAVVLLQHAGILPHTTHRQRALAPEGDGERDARDRGVEAQESDDEGDRRF
jgi:hypothetical protein